MKKFLTSAVAAATALTTITALAASPAHAQIIHSMSSLSSSPLSSSRDEFYDPGLPWNVALSSLNGTYLKINTGRISVGRLPVLRDKRLDARAQEWAEELSRTNSFRYIQQWEMQNIALIPDNEDPAQAYAMWREDPVEAGMMFAPQMRRVGLGAAHGYVEGKGWVYIIVMLGEM